MTAGWLVKRREVRFIQGRARWEFGWVVFLGRSALLSVALLRRQGCFHGCMGFVCSRQGCKKCMKS